MYHLFKLDLRRLDTYDQEILLQKFTLLPYKLRLVYRLSIFSYKILNNQILKKFKSNLIVFKDLSVSSRLRDLNVAKINQKIFNVPNVNTKHGEFKLSFFRPNFINNFIRNSFNLIFVEFKRHIKVMLLIFYNDFKNFFY